MIPLLTDLQPLLATKRLGRAVRGFPSTASTNTDARAWAEAAAPEGALVVADFQTGGHGRHGRAWVAEPGANLLLSLILHPPPEAPLGWLPLTAGIAVAEALDAFTDGVRPTLKWPNDVLLEGRKIGGLLAETVVRADQPPAVVLGIGLNVNQAHFPDEVADRATSLRLTVGHTCDRAAVLAALLAHLETRYDDLLRGPVEPLRIAFETRMLDLGAVVRVHPPHDLTAALEGTLLGVDSTGGLRLFADGKVHVVHAGEVTVGKKP